MLRTCPVQHNHMTVTQRSCDTWHAHACTDESHDSIGRHYIGGTEQIRDEYLEYELSQHGRQNLEE